MAGESSRNDDLAGMSKLHEYLVNQGKDVVYYGDNIDPEHSFGILMQWKIADDTYNIILVNFGALSLKTVNTDQLIELQRIMLQNRTK